MSPEAKDLIYKMLTVDPDARWSAKQLMGHPWLHQSGEILKADLAGTQEELKRYNAKRRFKAAVTAVLLTASMSKMIGGVNTAEGSSDSGEVKKQEEGKE